MVAESSLAQSSSASSSNGHLIVRSHPPLPRFTCVIPVPPSTSLVSQLRSTILAILTGQVSSKATKEQNGQSNTSAAATTAAAAESGLSFSEYLKQQTVHEWRLKSVVLELNQNALIAPETRETIDKGVEDQQDELAYDDNQREKGFVLQDEHECALLEHGDEINVWLQQGQTLESLRLPKLSSKHVYGLPDQPKLSRFGTILGLPPSYAKSQSREYSYKAPDATLLQPNEPSSHSSSVSAHPDGQFETRFRHQMPSNGWHRVVTVPSTQPGGLDAQDVTAKNGARRAKPKRLLSEGSNALLEQQPAARKTPARHNSASSPTIQARNKDERSAVLASPPLTSAPLTSNKEIVASQTAFSSIQAPSKAERAERAKVRKAGQRSMPPQALVIGPGVQGKVGRVSSFDSTRSGGETDDDGTAAAAAVATTPSAFDRNGKTSPNNGEYGNMDAFVAFTAASSEVHQMRQQNGHGPSSAARRMSNRSFSSQKGFGTLGMTTATADKDGIATQRFAANDVNGGNTGSNGQRLDSAGLAESKQKSPPVERYVKLPDKPELPAIRNLAPFGDDVEEEKRETLLPMPVPNVVNATASSSTPSSSSQQVAPSPSGSMSQRDLQLLNDAAIALALSESGPATPEPLAAAPVGANVRPSAKKHQSLNDIRPSSSKSAAEAAAPAFMRARQMSDRAERITSSPALTTRRSEASASSSPRITRQSSDSLAAQVQSPQSLSTPQGNEQISTGVATTTTTSPPPMSKAEKRFNEVKRALDAEKERQSAQDRLRAEKARKATEEKAKLLEKAEQERRQKEQRMRWQVWDEVRIRQSKEQAR